MGAYMYRLGLAGLWLKGTLNDEHGVKKARRRGCTS